MNKLSSSIKEYNSWFLATQESYYSWFIDYGMETLNEMFASLSKDFKDTYPINVIPHDKFIFDTGDYSFLLVSKKGEVEKLLPSFDINNENTDISDGESITSTIVNAGFGMETVRFIPANSDYEFSLINDHSTLDIDGSFLDAVDRIYGEYIEGIIDENNIDVNSRFVDVLITNFTRKMVAFYYDVPWADVVDQVGSLEVSYEAVLAQIFDDLSESVFEQSKQDVIDEAENDESDEGVSSHTNGEFVDSDVMSPIKTYTVNSIEAYIAACATVIVCDDEIDESEIFEAFKVALKSKLAIDLVKSLGSEDLENAFNKFNADDVKNIISELEGATSDSNAEMSLSDVDEQVKDMVADLDLDQDKVVQIIGDVKNAWDASKANENEFVLLDSISNLITSPLSSFVLTSCLDVAMANGQLKNEEEFALSIMAVNWGLEEFICNMLEGITSSPWSMMEVGDRKILISSQDDKESENDEIPELWDAILNKNSDRAMELIKQGVEVDELIDINEELRQVTPLMVSAEHYGKELCDVLINAGANVNQEASRGYVPLIWALKGEKIDNFKLLLDAGANPDPHENGHGDFSPLTMAVTHGLKEAVQLLIERDVRINWQDCKGRTALKEAAMKGHAQIMELLLDASADPNIYDNEGYSAIHNAVFNGDVEAVELLLNSGVDVNTPVDSPADEEGDFPVYAACYTGDFTMIKMLVEQGADIQTTVDSIKQLVVGISDNEIENPTEILNYLIEKGAITDVETLIGSAVMAPVNIFEILFKKLLVKMNELPMETIQSIKEILINVIEEQEDLVRKNNLQDIINRGGKNWCV